MSTTSGPTEPWRTGKEKSLPPMPSLIVSSAMSLSLFFKPVPDPGEAFLAPEQDQHIENPRRGGATGQRRPQRLRRLAELDAGLVGNLPHGPLDRLRIPLGQSRHRGMKEREQV